MRGWVDWSARAEKIPDWRRGCLTYAATCSAVRGGPSYWCGTWGKAETLKPEMLKAEKGRVKSKVQCRRSKVGTGREAEKLKPEMLKWEGKGTTGPGDHGPGGKAEILKAETLKSDPPPPGYGGQARLGCGTARQGAEIRELGFVEWARKLLLSCP